MMTPSQNELAHFLNDEANVAIARACHATGSKADALIAEAQELLALRTRLVERNSPRAADDQLAFPFLMKAAA